MNHFSSKIKEEVVFSIIHGELLVDEAMLKYNILAKATIIKWLKEAQLHDHNSIHIDDED